MNLMPDPSLLQGSAQAIMAWVILAQVALYIATVSYATKRLAAWEDKYDKLQVKTMKLAVRAQRAVETIANLPVPEVEEDLDEEDK